MALGHWLKDYLGPKASGEGGGGTVEFIKIASVYGASTPVAGEQSSVFTGGGSSLDGKSLQELVGDKKIIGVECKGVGLVGTLEQETSLNGGIKVSYGTNGYGSLIVDQDAIKNTSARFGINATALLSPTPIKQGAPVDIYAICI